MPSRCIGMALLLMALFSQRPASYARIGIRRRVIGSSHGQRSDTHTWTAATKDIDELVRHPAVEWAAQGINSHKSNARKKLNPKHTSLFTSSSLFDTFSTVVCSTGMIPRKEVFETWAAALHIDAHSAFTSSRRVADVAAGHGLLAWALLVMDHDARVRGERLTYPQRTALCIDRRLPQSAELLHTEMTAKWPELAPCFHFVEGALSDLVAHPSCLLVSVHACGGLSDAIVRTAIEANAPLALVPCCHSRKKITDYSAFAQEEYEWILFGARADTDADADADAGADVGANVGAGAGAGTGASADADVGAEAEASAEADVAQALDGARKTALRRAGYEVSTCQLPAQFTAKNNMIMGCPPTNPVRWRPPTPSGVSTRRLAMAPVQSADGRPGASIDTPPVKERLTKATNTAAKRCHLVPCADTLESRTAVAEMSGKDRSMQRQRERARAALYFDISFWLPSPILLATGTDNNAGPDPGPGPGAGPGPGPGAGPDPGPGAGPGPGPGLSPFSVTTDATDILTTLVHKLHPTVRATCALVDEYTDPLSSRTAQAYRLHYAALDDDDAVALTSDEAKRIHQELYAQIPLAIPGAVCRDG